MSDKCPFCAADCSNVVEWAEGKAYDWDCGSWDYPLKSRRSKDCYVRQIAQLQERTADLEKRLEDAEKRLEAWRDFWKAVKPWLYLEGFKNPLIPFIHRLKSLGEI